METAFESLVRFFETEGLKHGVDHDPDVVTAGFRGDNLSVVVYFVLDAETRILQLFAPLPTKVPEGCRPAVAEAIVRANYGMKVGKFEMDLADGELRFHAANIFPAEDFDVMVIRRLIGAVVHTLDRYFPAIMSVIYGNEAPKDAIYHVEQLVK